MPWTEDIVLLALERYKSGKKNSQNAGTPFRITH